MTMVLNRQNISSSKSKDKRLLTSFYSFLLPFTTFLLLISPALFAKPKQQQQTDNQVLTRTEVLTHYYFVEALNAWNMRDYGKAFSLFYYIHNINPQDAATCHYLSTLANGSLAMEWKKPAYENDPAAYWEDYAEALGKANRWQEAKEVITHASKLLPNDGYVWECLAEAYMQLDNTPSYKAALKVLQKQETLDGLTESITRNRIVCHLKTGKLKLALQDVDNYLLAHPEDEQFVIMKASIYLNIRDYENCYRELCRLDECYPQNPFVCLEWADLYEALGEYDKQAEAVYRATQIESWYLAHKIYIIRRNLDLLTYFGYIKPILNSLVNDYPNDESVLQLQVEHYEDVIDYEALRQCLRKLTDLNPENADVWDKWISTLVSIADMGGMETIEDEYAYVVEQGYKHCNSLKWTYLRAMLHIQNDEKEQAIQLLKTDLQKDEPEARFKFAALSLLGDMYMTTDSLDLAFEAYEQALALDPDNVYVLNNYAYLLADKGGDLSKAEKMSQKTILAEPDNAIYLDTYAWILYLQGQQSLAEFYIKKAVQNMDKEKNNAELWEHYNAIMGIDK